MANHNLKLLASNPPLHMKVKGLKVFGGSPNDHHRQIDQESCWTCFIIRIIWRMMIQCSALTFSSTSAQK